MTNRHLQAILSLHPDDLKVSFSYTIHHEFANSDEIEDVLIDEDNELIIIIKEE